MDKFATLEPVRLYASSAASSGARFLSRGVTKVPVITVPLIGRLPTDLHQLILNHIAIPDIPAYARTSRALNSLAKDGKYWDLRWSALKIDEYGLGSVLDDLEAARQGRTNAARASQPPVLAVSNDVDEFGDFTSSGSQDPSSSFTDFGDFIGSSPVSSPTAASAVFVATTTPSKKHRYIRAHKLLKTVAVAIASNPPHLVLPALSGFFAPPKLGDPSTMSSPSLSFLRQTAKALHLLVLFLSPSIQPIRAWSSLSTLIRAAMDRFDANMLAAFDVADGKGDEEGMRVAAEASWEVWEAAGHSNAKNASDWEMGKVWAEKREIFYEQSRWDPLENFTKDNALDFDAMDEFMTWVLKAIEEHGSRSVRVFPPSSQVLISFSERIAHEVVGEYITTLLTRAREISSNSAAIFLQASAASFKEAWRMVDAIMLAAEARRTTTKVVSGNNDSETSVVLRTRAEDVVYQMFETNMDEYLDDEVELVKRALEAIAKSWERDLPASSSSTFAMQAMNAKPMQQSSSTLTSQPRFLSSQNPAQVKRNVLASFTDVLLLPVTIVPRAVGTVGGAIVTGSKSLGMLNPAKWGGISGGSGKQELTPWQERVSKTGWGSGTTPSDSAYEKPREDDTVFDVGEEEDDEEEDGEKSNVETVVANKDDWIIAKEHDPWSKTDAASSKPAPAALARISSSNSMQTTSSAPSSNSIHNESKSVTSVNPTGPDVNLNKLDLLLSLDVALEMIHADREALKRIETFAGYPGHYGHRVRDSIEELFILVLQALGENHLRKGFERATEQMKAYQPADHEVTTSVAPLMQFFELVHVGDTIQSMVQVYFDKELVQYIDRTDFLNPVVREKKRFENALDDSVAAGLNAGTEVLMNQVDHIILTLTRPREYYPPEDAPLDLGATRGCTEAIKCLEKHCKLLKGSTSKEVLEVFYQEVGIRLLAILQKHIKRQIISLNGGFQVIADLNTYHAFIASLKVPSIAADFSHLKMLGHVYVVEDAKDLAQIVRDVTRYGGAYRPEDIYEFIQRRSDWKKIEKTVDKTMYNLSFKEDCVVC